MNHKKQYEALMAKAQARSRPEGYVERHHIVPRSLGGADTPENLVWLTAREHFVAHILLAYVHGGSQWSAVMWFGRHGPDAFNSRLYEAAKRNQAAKMSEKFKGKPLSPAHRARIGAGLKGNRNTAGTVLSDAHKLRIGKGLLGNTNTAGKHPSDETRAKMAAAHAGEKHQYFGKARSAETRAKISSKLSGTVRGPRSEETKARIRAGVLAANARKTGINPNPNE